MYNTLSTCENVFLQGPAKSLFERPYFEKMKAALRPGGIICSMGTYARCCEWIVSGWVLYSDCTHSMTFMTAGHIKLGEIKKSPIIMGVISSYVARIFRP